MELEIAVLVISLIMFAIGLLRWQKGSGLMSHGKKASAVIYKNNFRSDRDGGVYYPVVRFLTEKKEWITQELDVGYNPPIEEGLKLEVVYDPEEPTIVEINEHLQLAILPRIFVAVGICGLTIGILELLEVTQFF